MLDIQKISVGDELEIDFSYRHPYYRQMYSNWVKNRDFVRGSEFVKSRTYNDLNRFEDESGLLIAGFSNLDGIDGTAYLPVPKAMEQEPKLYRDYRDRAQLYNASGMTRKAFMGMLYRKPPVFQYEPGDADLEEDIKKKVLRKVTPDGRSFTDLCRQISSEVITTNKVGILVDFPLTLREHELSVLEYEELNLTPKASVYSAESIINWHTIEINDEMIPDYFVLDESTWEMNYETFAYEFVEQYRILLLVESENDYVYHQLLVKKSDKKGSTSVTKKKFEVVDSITPMKDNRELNRIPFYVIDADGINYGETTESMLNDLVDVNMGHYRNSADWEHNLYFLGLKTLVLPGYDRETNGDPTVGGIITGPTGFAPQLIEPTSDSGLEKEMKNKEERMAVLGAQAISQRGKYVQSASTAKINSASESSILASLAHSQSSVMTTILNLILGWSGYPNIRGNIHINTDFFDDMISADAIIKWSQLVQSGAISRKTWYYNLEKRDIFPPEWSLTKEVANIEEDSEYIDDELIFKNTPLGNMNPREVKQESRPDPDESTDDQEKQEFSS